MIGNFKTTDRRNSDNLRSYLLRMKKKIADDCIVFL